MKKHAVKIFLLVAAAFTIGVMVGRWSVSKEQPLQGRDGYAVQTGPRGGQFYINKNGNKVYLPRDEANEVQLP